MYRRMLMKLLAEGPDQTCNVSLNATQPANVVECQIKIRRDNVWWY